MSILRQLAILVVIAAAAGTVFYLRSGGESADARSAGAPAATAEEPPAPVIVQRVGYSSDAAVVEAVGSGEATQAVTLYPEAAGRVTGILFTAGQKVSEDQSLLRLDEDEERLAVQLAEVRLRDARQQLARYENTAPSGAVSTSEVESARTAVAAARIQLSQAELALERRTLRAPFAGVVSIPEVDIGDRVSTTTPITTLDDRSTVLVDFEVPESFAGGVRLGADVTATTWGLPGERFSGVVDSVASRIDARTRTLRVRARIDNSDDRLRTGMSFTIRLPLTGERFPSVPSISVQWDRRGPYVWRVVGDVAERVDVDVMKRDEQWILVDAPLARGDRIVVEGVQRLRSGRQVEITATDTIAAGDSVDEG